MEVIDFLQLGKPIPAEVFKLSVANAYNQIIITNINGIILYANKGLERITGYSPDEVIGKTQKMWGGLMDGVFYAEMWKQIKEVQKPFYGEILNRRKDGTEYWAIAAISPILDYNNKLTGFIGTEEEATLYHSIKDQLLANHLNSDPRKV